jgi:putative membrane protein
MPSPESRQDEDSTVKTASAISEGVFRHALTEDEKKVAGPAVHYAFGAGVGGVYGALAEMAPL